jgi:hypothetical protein
MKTNKLQVLYMLITSLLFAVVFGTLVGGDDASVSYSIAAISFVGSLALTYGYSPKDKKEMAMTCGAIASGLSLNCEDPLVAGVVATFYLANKEDIASITYDATNPMLATDITMKASKFFYRFEGQLQSTEPLFAMVKGKYVNQYEHTVGFLIFNLAPSIKKEILNMKDGNFVAIIENNYVSSTGDTKYEIYGAGAGLKAEVMERNPNDTENLGAFKISLKTQEYARESKPPVSLFDTDLATTETLVLGLWD